MSCLKYSIKVNEVKNGSENARGIVSVTLGDSFKINNIMIMNDPREENKLFVSMPSYMTGNEERKDVVHPTTKEFHDELYGNILKAYQELTENQAKNSYTVEYNKRDSKMPDFSVRVTPYEREGSTIRGIGSISFPGLGLMVNNVAIHAHKDSNGKENLFVSMPSYKTGRTDEQGKAVYKDICHPVTAKFREKLYGVVLQRYEAAKAQEQEADKVHPKDSVRDKLNKNVDAAKSGEAKDQQHKRDEVER